MVCLVWGAQISLSYIYTVSYILTFMFECCIDLDSMVVFYFYSNQIILPIFSQKVTIGRRRLPATASGDKEDSISKKQNVH